ncbi:MULTISPECIES: hypothetical protein [unclassified Pseudomonas]|uniref:hypothetical protein n=1 Tax=unclassified Pseudomonas TaxID=196821 RepID=UPI000A1F68E7|nr:MULTISPECIES: hypothetical protein [unclassified Pseudomonas]
MSSAVRKNNYSSQLAPREEFTANLENGSTFKALYTVLEESTTPGRGDVYMVIAYDRQNTYARTFTIVFKKSTLEGRISITDDDLDSNVIFNNYEDPENPTLQKATGGILSYKLDIAENQFSGSFIADVTKADGSGTFPCTANFDTWLS